MNTGYSGVYAYLYARNQEKALILVNTTVEGFDTITFQMDNFAIHEISVVDRETGEVRKADFAVDGNQVTVFEPFEYLSTQTLILK